MTVCGGGTGHGLWMPLQAAIASSSRGKSSSVLLSRLLPEVRCLVIMLLSLLRETSRLL